MFKQSLLPRIGSDHNPILLACGDWIYKKTNSKLVARIEGLKKKVKAWWLSFPNRGRPTFIHANKLKLLKKELMQWSRSKVFGLGGEGDWKQEKKSDPTSAEILGSNTGE